MTADQPAAGPPGPPEPAGPAGSGTADPRARVTRVLLLAFVLGLVGTAGCGGPGPGPLPLPGSARPASAAALARARRWSAYLLAATGTVPPGTGVFGLKDNLGQPMDCELHILQRNASQPDLVAAGGGFLLATEATSEADSSYGAHYLDVRYYPSVTSLMLGRPARALVLPHRLAKPDSGVEGTPDIAAADLRGGLGHSAITITFHYLSAGLDREGVGVLTDFSRWSAQQDDPLDDALTGAGLAGKHGDRSFVPGTGDDLELVEAQRDAAADWQVYLYNRVSGAVTSLPIRTPGASRSFANPTIGCVPDPAGATVAVVTFFLPNQQAGPEEAGELLYYQPSPLCAH